MSDVLVLARHDLVSLRRWTVWWTAGVVALAVLNLAFWPSLEGSEAMEAFEDIGALLEAFGAQDLATASGYLDGQLFALMLPMLLAGMAIAAVSGRTAGDEDQGRLEVLLALPVSRRVVWVGRFGACAVSMATVAVATGLVVVLGRTLFSLEEVAVSSVAGATLGSGALALLGAAVTYAAAGTGASRGASAGIGSAVVVASYVMAYLAPLVESLQGVRSWSPWHWALGEQPVSDGVAAGSLGAVLVIAALLVFAGTVAVGRRDVHSP
jgi:ABC-2 type transport system permease protein